MGGTALSATLSGNGQATQPDERGRLGDALRPQRRRHGAARACRHAGAAAWPDRARRGGVFAQGQAVGRSGDILQAVRRRFLGGLYRQRQRFRCSARGKGQRPAACGRHRAVADDGERRASGHGRRRAGRPGSRRRLRRRPAGAGRTCRNGQRRRGRRRHQRRAEGWQAAPHRPAYARRIQSGAVRRDGAG